MTCLTGQQFNIGTLEEAFQYDKPVPEGPTQSLLLACSSSSSPSSPSSSPSCEAPLAPPSPTQPATYNYTLAWIWRQRWYGRDTACSECEGGLVRELSVIHSLARSNLPATGNLEITVMGQNFGMSDVSGLMYIGDSTCAVSEWQSDSSVYSLSRAGERNERAAAFYLCNVCQVASPDPNVCVWGSFGVTCS